MSIPVSEMNQIDEPKLLGLRDNPFKSINAATENAQDLMGYSVGIGGVNINSIWNSKNPCLITGERGSGKTTCRRLVASKCWPYAPKSTVFCFEYTHKTLTEILNYDSQMVPLAHVRAIIHGADEVLKENERWIPNRQKLSMADSGHLAAANMLLDFALRIQQMGFSRCLCLIDGIDEHGPLRESPDKMVEFLSPLLEQTELLISSSVTFHLFLPTQVLNSFSIQNNRLARLDLMNLYSLKWDQPELADLIRQRLAYYSNSSSPLKQIGQLCEEPLSRTVDREIIGKACTVEQRARALVALGYQLLEYHRQRAKPGMRISQESWQLTCAWFDANAARFGISNQAFAKVRKFQLRAGWILFDGRILPLSGISESLLKHLIEADGAVVTHAELKTAWPDKVPEVSSDNFKKAMSRLKKTLKENNIDTAYIQAVSRRGYRLNTDLD